jgi:transcriptional regulator with XRE-family HTH domain
VGAGSRIREYRLRLGMTQEVLAGLAGVSVSWVGQVERGVISPGSLRSVIPVAQALRVDPMDLIEVPRTRRDGAAAGGTSNGLHTLVLALRTYPYELPETGTADLAGIRRRLDQADSLRRRCRYDEAGPLLATLIADAETAARVLEDTEHEREAFTSLSHVYRLCSPVLNRGGEEHDVAWIAVDRCSAAARRSGDPLLHAFAARCRAHAFAHFGWVTQATATIMPAIDALAPAAWRTPPQTSADPWWAPDPASLWGALLLAGALSAARSNDPAEARRLLRQAETTAVRVSRDDELFGPTNTAIHAVSCAIELGDATATLRLGETVDPSPLPSDALNRRAQVHVDLARAYEQKRQHESALHRLLEAERIAPEFTHGHSIVREMVSAMLHRREGRSRTSGLRELADRVGVTAPA